MLIGVVWILALNRLAIRRIHALILLTPIWAGVILCVSHALFGFVAKSLYLVGHHGAVDFLVVPGVDAVTAADANHLSAAQDLLVFETCFLILGLVLTLAAWQFLCRPPQVDSIGDRGHPADRRLRRPAVNW
ncbi:hypothetical protein ABZY19_28835 [Streptomyces sp. NPDC006475]|uniref:hypothetical protein n=1 Tax=Streptomyces sp. NPDC006475 TaxID=3155719 RepID=UPI0033BF8B22